MREFDDWIVNIPFKDGELTILCCSEDKVCAGSKPCSSLSMCASCRVLLCFDCRKFLLRDTPEMPPACLANDMMIFYAQPEMYTEAMTVIEMICCSVCITSMICFSLEVKYGNMFDSQVHMQRHRVGARGNATTFPLPWQQLLAELENMDLEASRQETPDLPKVGADLAHVVQVSALSFSE